MYAYKNTCMYTYMWMGVFLHWDRSSSSLTVLRSRWSSAGNVFASVGIKKKKDTKFIKHCRDCISRKKWNLMRNPGTAEEPTLQVIVNVDSSSCNCHLLRLGIKFLEILGFCRILICVFDLKREETVSCLIYLF